MKRRLILMFIFSFLAHMTVAGTMIYLPYHFSKSDEGDHPGQIIWGTIENQVTGGSEQVREGPPILPIPHQGKGKKVRGDSEKNKVKESVSDHKPEVSHQDPEMGVDPVGDNQTTENRDQELKEAVAADLNFRSIGDVENQGLEAKGQETGVTGLISGTISDYGECVGNIRCTGGIGPMEQASKGKTGESSKNMKSDSLNIFLAHLRGEIEKNKHYPLVARTNGITGTVYLNFHIGSDGRPEHIELSKSSGSQILDESAISTLKKIKQFSSVPEEIREVDITVPIAYKLTEESKN